MGTAHTAGERPPPRGWDRSGERPTTLLLVRHGSTIHSLDGRFSGRNDLPLDGPGTLQAQAVAAYLAELEPADAILTSPLRRARDTAEAIAELAGTSVQVDDDLVELDFGEWEGLTFDEAGHRWPTELANWLESDQVAVPGGESFAVVAERAQCLLSRVLTEHAGQRVVAVSHVTPIKTLLRLALGAPHDAIFRFHLDTASVSIVDHYADGSGNVRLLNRSEQRH